MPRGERPFIEAVATTELTTSHLGRYLAQARSPSQVPVDLVPPTVTLTPKQLLYGGADFTGLEAIKSDRCCTDINLRWVDGTQSGLRKLEP